MHCCINEGIFNLYKYSRVKGEVKNHSNRVLAGAINEDVKMVYSIEYPDVSIHS